MNKAVIIGKDHHNALGIVESLGRKGVYSYLVILTLHKKSYVAHSKYVKQGWCCANEDDVLNTLINNFTDKENKAVAYACDDTAADILDKNHDLLSKIMFLPTVAKAGTLNEWMRKEKMSSLAENVGMKVPKTWISRNSEIPVDIQFPVITKAHSSVEGGKSNLHICKNKDELETVMKSNHCEIMVIQQYIEKIFEFQLIGCSLGGACPKSNGLK